MKPSYRNMLAGALSAASLGAAGAAAAAVPLLDAPGRTQLEQWLGAGAMTLSTIFTKQSGDTAADFHAAADGKGATFSVMEISNAAGQSWLVGGYNPVSWNSLGQPTINPDNAGRSAFLFNLTEGLLYRQLPKPMDQVADFGATQAVNDAALGPTFGAGYDLHVPNDLSTGAYSYMASYFAVASGAGYSYSIVDGSAGTAPMTIRGLEVYAISAVPEPAAWLLLLAGLGLCALYRQRPQATPAARA